MVINSKRWFNESADLKALTERNKVDLTVSSTRNTIRQELERRGWVATRATSTVLMVIEKGQVKGSRWVATWVLSGSRGINWDCPKFWRYP